MGKPSPPEPPDPKETGAAQTGTNIGTAVANNTMQMVERVNPYGSLTYEELGSKSWSDPYTGKTYDLPRYREVTTLNPNAQAAVDAQQASQRDLAELASERSNFLRDYLPNTEAATDQIDSKLYDLGRQRIDPRMAQQREAMQTRLANQGIAAGSEAYNREMELVGQQENDAYNQLLLSGRGQAASEVNMPINQITALLSGSQVQSPNYQPFQPNAAATTDVAGLINTNYNQRYQNYQQQAGQTQNLLGGLFGLGSNLILSDRRRKRDIVRIGEADGLPVYRFRYMHGNETHIGFMAQDVQKVKPGAVSEIAGTMFVDYAQLPEVSHV